MPADLNLDMSEKTKIRSDRSKIYTSSSIYRVASLFMCEYIATKELNDSNRDAIMDKSLKLAMDLARLTDKVMSVSSRVNRPRGIND